MSFWNTFFGGGDVIKAVGQVLDDTITSDEERMSLKNEMFKAEYEFKTNLANMETSLLLGQMKVNETEARTGSLFIAGWRPAIGWIGAICLFYNFVVYPLLKLSQPDLPPPIEAEVLWTMITGMLGIGGMRSFDKYTGKDTRALSGLIKKG